MNENYSDVLNSLEKAKKIRLLLINRFGLNNVKPLRDNHGQHNRRDIQRCYFFELFKKSMKSQS